jgi:molybdate transport system ATP-binding protein
MIDVDVHLARGAFRLDVAFAAEGGIVALFGPSGSGKSTVIGLLAGLLRPDAGHVRVGGATLVDTRAGVFVPSHRRRVGVVFQDPRLFPHLTVRQNLLYGRWFAPPDARGVAFDPVVETLGIGPLLGRRPRSLSGGEKQRVAFGRAVLAAPRLLLMDEPLAALDAARKREMLPLVERLRDAFGIPIVYVSHAADEVARLADRVVMLDGGRVSAIGTPAETLRGATEPENRFAVMSVLAGVTGTPDEAGGLTPVLHPAGVIWTAGLRPAGRAARVIVRGTDVALSLSPPVDLSVQTGLAGTVGEVRPAPGPYALVDVALDGGDVLASVVTRRAVERLALRAGTRVHALVKSAALDDGPSSGS